MAGRDYVPAKGTLVFPPGATLRTNFVGVFGNTLSQSNRAFIVNLSNPVNAAIKSGRAIGSILDNDAGPALFINDVTVKEGSASTNNALFTVRLSAPSGKTVTVNYSTSDGTALSGLDYVPTTGTLLFAPGVTNQTLAVAVIDDTLSENTETFLVHLSQPVNAVIGDGQGVATILDDDPFPVVSIADTTVTEANSGVTNSALFPVFLSTRSGKTINVSYTTINATALAAKDFIPISGTVTFLPGTTNQFIRMSVLGDSLSEGNETFAVRLTNAVNATLARAVAVCTRGGALPSKRLTASGAGRAGRARHWHCSRGRRGRGRYRRPR